MSEVRYSLIVGFENYRIGTDGSFWTRLERKYSFGGQYKGVRYIVTDSWTEMKPALLQSGYLQVRFGSRKGTIVQKKIHTLVLENFVGPRPPGMVVRHLNGIKTDNRLENLAWGSHKENYFDMIAHGTAIMGESSHLAKLTDVKVREIMEVFGRTNSVTETSSITNVSRTNVGNIVYGWTWNHVTGLAKRR